MPSIIDQPWFSNISRPSRYIGNEVNSIRKDLSNIDVSIALAFPDVYEVGMSHLGLKILYHILNAQHWLAAERVFAPWIDLEMELRNRSIPLGTLESDRPMSLFDIVGFSLQHELSYTNVLNMLDLAGIPFLSAERDSEYPLIIAGGPACFNPEPVAEFFDAILIGDGEAAALEICRTLRKAKQNGTRSRKELLSQLGRIKGIYIPSFFNFYYNGPGYIKNFEPLVPGYKAVEKAIVPDIDEHPYPDCQIVPFTELVHDRLVLEVSRGCTRGCRFCQAGMIYRPVRERGPGSILEKAEQGLALTGHEDLSLLSLSSGDYTCIEPLLKALMDRQSSKKIAVSLPSLRIDSLNTSLMKQIKRVRKTGFTLAPEAGNDRLRRVINKGLTQEDILKTARTVYGAGWKLIKLYFMVGLPTEEDKDLQDMIKLANMVAGLAGGKGKRANLNVSLSTFVPKSHTPFMWMPQISLEESRRKIQWIRDELKGGRVRVKWNQPELSRLEGIFSRGDRRLGRVLIEAWKLGAGFDAWGEHFKIKAWEEAFDRTGLDPHFYLHREKALDEILPWDHIKSGVNKIFLKNELKKAHEEKSTHDCREKCMECGVCDHKTVDPILFTDSDCSDNLQVPLMEKKPAPSRKYRITFTKLDHARYLGHLELVRVFTRAFKRAGLSLVYSKGFHPMPKVSFACALPVGTESMQETVDIEVSALLESSTLKDMINNQLPSGINVTLVEEILFGKKRQRLKESHFLISISGVELNEEALQGFLKSNYFTIVKTNKKGEHSINARPLVKAMDLISSRKVKVALKHMDGPELKPVEIIKGVFSLKNSHINDIKVLKIKQLLS
ncbi:MAG: TIGR03960 family B12-binding radical SAM protein [Desulfobacterales bacterium]|nr:TIGR03960 family B12-binding radical SAM protein [Desulfobacterales bacterium]